MSCDNITYRDFKIIINFLSRIALSISKKKLLIYSNVSNNILEWVSINIVICWKYQCEVIDILSLVDMKYMGAIEELFRESTWSNFVIYKKYVMRINIYYGKYANCKTCLWNL